MPDLPREELIREANETLARWGMDTVTVHFKFTCDVCGTRNTFNEPNMIFETGECLNCGHVQEITQGGYMLVAKLGLKVKE